MIKYLFFASITFVMLISSCSNNSSDPTDTSNNIEAGFRCDVSGDKNFTYSVNTATAALSVVDGKTAFSIMATSTNPEAPYQFAITVFGKTTGTYEQTLANADNPQAICTVVGDSSRIYVSVTGKVILTEVGATLGANVKGTFNFELKSGLEGDMKITNGSFNVPMAIL